MFGLRGLLVLKLTTSTPDALCPPLPEAQAAVEARVGQVRGAYQAEFAVIRGAHGQQVLDLRVREGSREVLRRELPLNDAGCQDAAQAIALVLERYFEAIEKPLPTEIAATLEPVPKNAYRPPPRPPVPPARLEEANASRAYATWQARAGFLYDAEFGAAPSFGLAVYPPALRWAGPWSAGIQLEVAPFLANQTQLLGDEEIAETTWQFALAWPISWHMGDWSVAAGPWAQLRLQHATASSLAHQQAQDRTVAGLGGVGQLSLKVTPRWTLGAGFAVGGQLKGATARFALLKADMTRDAVLIPKAWFGQAMLTIALGL